ncbi:DoxX family protein [Urbifossiella limnaea]|uniref:DoxX family protein n=1 Tax=Urbifossiella limnaea TaxID=2528023 RepID=A0A517XRF6_9BACT|nr:DoxX family protein [Urbifossiella limnaea]QDU20094.1 hypothetical protein ETAA1_20370 [Urbifossiella limnaea]
MDVGSNQAPVVQWAGRVISGLVVAFLLVDAGMKVVGAGPVLEASARLGIPTDAIRGIGLVLLASTTLYALPRTAVLGAILLTGYLGGAAATHVNAGDVGFPVGFAVGLGVLAWLGLALREPRLFGTIFLGR